jgi:hypothetical protein
MTRSLLVAALISFTSCPLTVSALEVAGERGPQAGLRTYKQNFKDMVLATCIAKAYQDEPRTSADVGSSVSALRDWTYYDLESGPDVIGALVNNYLKKDYSNPLVEAEIKGIEFNFLKCLDLYHGNDLEDVAARLVFDPEQNYRSKQSKEDR